MTRTSRTGWALVAAVLVAGAVSVAGAARTTVSPKASTTAIDGAAGKLRLADYRGRVVLVKFWASWCEQCQAAYPQIAALRNEYGARGLEVVAISVDSDRRKAQAFVAARPSPIVVAFDPRGRMLDLMGAAAVPASFVLDRSGAARFTHVGYTADTLAEYRREIEQLLAEPAR